MGNTLNTLCAGPIISDDKYTDTYGEDHPGKNVGDVSTTEGASGSEEGASAEERAAEEAFLKAEAERKQAEEAAEKARIAEEQNAAASKIQQRHRDKQAIADAKKQVEAKRVEKKEREAEELAKREAAKKAADSLVQEFLRKNKFASVNEVKKSTMGAKSTPLSVAIDKKSVVLVSALLTCGADKTCELKKGVAALQYAEKADKKGSHKDIIEELKA